MSENDRVRLAENFAPYIGDNAGHYSYRVKGKDAIQEHLQRIGERVYARLRKRRPTYAAENAFQVLERLFSENFSLVESQAHPKANEEISLGCLQSVDDLEATCHTKGNDHYQGCVANLTETCEPSNEIQLIAKGQVTARHVDDSQLLAEALPNPKERTDAETMVTDGALGSETSNAALQTAQVSLIQTAIRGRSPSADKLHLADFSLKFSPQGKPSKVTCPQGHTVPVQTGAHQKAFVAHFDPAVCQTCQLLDHCPARPGKRDQRHHLNFTQAEARAAERRRTGQEHAQDRHNLPSAVESSVRSLKHPFPAGKLPARGMFRVACMIIGAAVMTNLRRLHRDTAAKIKAAQAILNEKDQPVTSPVSFFATLARFLLGWLCPRTAHTLVAGC